MKKNKILIIRFQNSISPNEIPLFRGAIIKALGKDNDILFHNHTEENFRYEYPLIQYKCIGQKAVLVCINEGTSAIGKFFAACNLKIAIGKRKEILQTENIQASQCDIQITDTPISYHIHKWLPLNSENYQRYNRLEHLSSKIQFLEKILTGNILSLAKSLEIFFTDRIICKISTLTEPHLIIYKQINLMSFDVNFKTNVILPDYVGLGKGVSLGYGTIIRKYENQ